MSNKSNLFKMIRENGATEDERIFKGQATVHSSMFIILRLIFGIAISFKMPQYEKGYLILFGTFYFMVWIEPLIFSIKGLWVNDILSKVAIITGCFLSAHGIMRFLESFLYPGTLISAIITLAGGIFFGIGTYFIYTISYSNYIKKQDID